MIDALLFSLALAVGLTPQLLPAIININLARGAQRMATNGVIVRRLAAIENFGSMDLLFQTGWFIESIVSATLIVFVLRTRLPFFRSRPSGALVLVTAAVIAVTVALPYTPLAAALGFTALPATTLLLLALIVLGYVVSAESVKQWFYQRMGSS